ncbi:hypothetical protein M728_005174 (plasmid) [Ensifer sp. WSM1721]|uniref:hypothetical protein n=1 Tax=Ensifer sp. WSM1721 TaxID=1041159 RepID=UPI000688B9B1|nr:hypothetical protein [Ensifer sp. WSM1721]
MIPGLPDTYTLRARIIPALIAAIPVFVLATLSVPWDRFSLPQVLSSLSVAILLFALSDFARRHGRRIEPKIYAKAGGKPTVTMLRHRDSTLDEVTKAKIVAFLSSKIAERPPTVQEEDSDPIRADAFYERCGTWLRENTRDQKRFAILFNDNVTYGYRRNLLGLKPIALTLNTIVLLAGLAVLFYRWDLGIADELNGKMLGVAIIAFFHSVYLTLGVTESSVAEASRTYARQLLLSCVALSEGDGPKSRKPKSSSARPRKILVK